jgi:hypothetical protein
MIEITDEMVEAARLARYSVNTQPLDDCTWRIILTAVAPLIAAAEREACAKVAEAMQQVIGALPGSSISSTCVEIAAAIRARGGEA